jgi:phospholipid/cholesterol/gamma-HCH transport system substrate-binding protein
VALNKDIKVALLAILSITIFIVSYLFMKGTLMQSGKPRYNAIFQNVDKLKKSDKVYLNGVTIGTVDILEFKDINNPTEVNIVFTADNGLKIPKDSKIQVISTSLMGNMGLKLILGESKEILKENETIIGIGEDGIFQSLSKEVGPLAKSSDSLLKNVNTLFNRNQNENLYATIYEMNRTLASVNMALVNMNKVIESNQKPIHQTMVNFERISSSLATKQEDINTTIKNIKEITGKANQADIGALMNKLNGSINEMNTLLVDINQGNGSLGKLMKDPVLYNNLNTTVNNANELLIDFKSHPKRYVGFSIFGGKN